MSKRKTCSDNSKHKIKSIKLDEKRPRGCNWNLCYSFRKESFFWKSQKLGLKIKCSESDIYLNIIEYISILLQKNGNPIYNIHTPKVNKHNDLLIPYIPMLPNTNPLRILVLDNDETTGDYQCGSFLFELYKFCYKKNPPHDYFITKYLIGKNGIRPGTIDLLKIAYALKKIGKIDHIMIFTAASNDKGWVTYLIECLLKLADLPSNTISNIITKENCISAKKKSRVIKDLSMICSDTSNILIIDDKPEFIRNGKYISVNPYHVQMSIKDLVDDFTCSKEKREIIDYSIQEDKKKYPDCFTKYTKNQDMNEMYSVIREITQFFS